MKTEPNNTDMILMIALCIILTIFNVLKKITLVLGGIAWFSLITFFSIGHMIERDNEKYGPK